jgi:hypothetical protein
VTRKLRRLVGDDNNIVSLIMGDYDAETWDAAHKNLVDGVCTCRATTRALRQVLKIAPGFGRLSYRPSAISYQLSAS